MGHPERRPLIAGNWKLNKTVSEALSSARELSQLVMQVREKVEVVIAPVFTAIHPVAKQLEGTNVGVAGQDLHWEQSGAFTGEVSATQLREAGARYVLIGHSERRQMFGETDLTVNRKLGAANKAGLIPIVCFGETLQEREAGQTIAVVERQVTAALAGCATVDLKNLVLAYEPVWAIGTGKTATSAQAQEVHATVRKLLATLHGAGTAQATRILYGGSVKPENVAELMQKPDVDGALVGGASLAAADFARIVRFDRGM